MAPTQMVTMTYNPKTIARFRRVLSEGPMSMSGHVNNLAWLWKERVRGKTVADVLARNEQLVWSNGQNFWLPGSERHLAYKAKRGYSPLTLVMTHRLYNAATMPGAVDNIAYGDARNFFYGINTENFREPGGWSYPEIHQWRGDARGVTRPFMLITDWGRRALDSWFGRAMRNKLSQLYGSRYRGRRR